MLSSTGPQLTEVWSKIAYLKEYKNVLFCKELKG